LNPTIFPPNSTPAWGFIVLLLVSAIIASVGLLEVLKKHPQPIRFGAVIGVAVLTIVILIAVIRGAASASPVNIYNDRITSNSWSVPLETISGVRFDSQPIRIVTNGRTTVTVKRKLVVDLSDGSSQLIGYESGYDIDGIKISLENAIALHRSTKQKSVR